MLRIGCAAAVAKKEQFLAAGECCRHRRMHACELGPEASRRLRHLLVAVDLARQEPERRFLESRLRELEHR